MFSGKVSYCNHSGRNRRRCVLGGAGALVLVAVVVVVVSFN